MVCHLTLPAYRELSTVPGMISVSKNNGNYFYLSNSYTSRNNIFQAHILLKTYVVVLNVSKFLSTPLGEAIKFPSSSGLV